MLMHLECHKYSSFIVIFCFLSAFLAIELVPVCKGNPAVIHVPGDYPTLQSAIDNAAAGDTILVKAGVYGGVRVNKPLQLIGEDRNGTIIDGAAQTCGVAVSVTGDVVVANFTIQNCGGGYSAITLTSCYNSTIVNNTVSSNYADGILCFNASNNKIQENLFINNNGMGVSFQYGSSGNTFFDNIVSSSGFHNLDFSGGSSSNKLFHNNFINSHLSQGYINPDSLGNSWDDGFPSGGNYWDDYTGSGSYGIGGPQYAVDPYNKDRYPLTAPFSSFNVTNGVVQEYTVGFISNSSISGVSVLTWLSSPTQYLQPGQEYIDLKVYGPNQTKGFCRMTIPKGLLEGPYSVILDGTLIQGQQIASDNTNNYLYFVYDHSQHGIIVIPEFSSFMETAILMSAILAVFLIMAAKKQKLVIR